MVSLILWVLCSSGCQQARRSYRPLKKRIVISKEITKSGKIRYNPIQRPKIGYQSSNFHRLCDNKGPLVFLIKSTTGSRFCGYTEENSVYNSSQLCSPIKNISHSCLIWIIRRYLSQTIIPIPKSQEQPMNPKLRFANNLYQFYGKFFGKFF